jgi:bacterioferritin-associated ferredoxin
VDRRAPTEDVARLVRELAGMVTGALGGSVYVCLCMGITDRDARAAIDAGAATVGGVLRACGSGRSCGGCSPTIRGLIAEAHQARAAMDPDGVVDIDRYKEAR